MNLHDHLKRLWARMHWRKSAPAAPTDDHAIEQATAVKWMQKRVPQTLDARHRERFMDIGPDAWIFSDSDQDIVLEGTHIKRLVIPAKRQVKIKSPVLEPVHGLDGTMMLREWDALFVANEMIENYCRSRWYDLADPEDLRICTLPFPKRSLARIAEKIGLRAEREGDTAQAG